MKSSAEVTCGPNARAHPARAGRGRAPILASASKASTSSRSAAVASSADWANGILTAAPSSPGHALPPEVQSSKIRRSPMLRPRAGEIADAATVSGAAPGSPLPGGVARQHRRADARTAASPRFPLPTRDWPRLAKCGSLRRINRVFLRRVRLNHRFARSIEMTLNRNAARRHGRSPRQRAGSGASFRLSRRAARAHRRDRCRPACSRGRVPDARRARRAGADHGQSP